MFRREFESKRWLLPEKSEITGLSGSKDYDQLDSISSYFWTPIDICCTKGNYSVITNVLGSYVNLMSTIIWRNMRLALTQIELNNLSTLIENLRKLTTGELQAFKASELRTAELYVRNHPVFSETVFLIYPTWSLTSMRILTNG